MAVDTASTAMRLIHLLQALPSAGMETATQLRDTLERQGYTVGQRMIERDLRKLEGEGLAHAREGKPLGWARGQAALGLQLQDLNHALALDMMATFAGDLKTAKALHYAMRPLYRAAFIETNPVPAKMALALMGRFPFEVRLPLVPLEPGNKAKLEAVLKTAGLL